MKTRDEIIEAFVELRESIEIQRQKEGYANNPELDGMLIAMGRLSYNLYGSKSWDFVEEVISRTNLD